MEKIFKYIGIALIAGFIVLVSIIYLTTPPKAKVDAIQAFIQITKLYTERKVIDPKQVEVVNEDFKFLKYWAEYLRNSSDAIKAANNRRRIAVIAVNPENTKDSEALSRSYEKLALYQKVIEDSNKANFDILNKLVENMKSIDKEETIFDPEAIIEYAGDEAEYFNSLNAYKVTVAQYLTGILDFLKSRQGFYTVNGSIIAFEFPTDQQYYENLMREMQSYDNELRRFSNQHRESLRQDLNKIWSE